MATINVYQRKDGSKRYTAQIRIMRKGEQYSESRTFDRKALATQWAEKRERELQAPGALKIVRKITVAQLIDQYIERFEDIGQFGRNKVTSLRFLKRQPIAQVPAMALTSGQLIEHASERRRAGVGPSTVNNDLVWLRLVFKAMRAAADIPLDLQPIDDAVHMLRVHKVIARAKQRDRRPTAEELAALLDHFRRRRHRMTIPMAEIIEFAVRSGRREAEICRLAWADLRPEADPPSCLLRDAKHPRYKEGNHRWFWLLPEALAIIQRQSREGELIFPYNPQSIGERFRAGCFMLGIKDLRFHDLRHEATSQLFEAGLSIPMMAQYTLHEDWKSLKRYTHLQNRYEQR